MNKLIDWFKITFFSKYYLICYAITHCELDKKGRPIYRTAYNCSPLLVRTVDEFPPLLDMGRYLEEQFGGQAGILSILHISKQEALLVAKASGQPL